LLYQENEKSVKQYLKEVIIKGLIDYWNWKEFIIRSIYCNALKKRLLFIYLLDIIINLYIQCL